MFEYTFNNYQDEIDAFAVYPSKGEGNVMAISYVALGLGEAGEVQGKVKKILRDDDGIVTDEKRAAIAGELGDVLWYVTRLAHELGLNVEDIAKANVAKLLSRKERGVLGGSGDNR